MILKFLHRTPESLWWVTEAKPSGYPDPTGNVLFESLIISTIPGSYYIVPHHILPLDLI